METAGRLKGYKSEGVECDEYGLLAVRVQPNCCQEFEFERRT